MTIGHHTRIYFAFVTTAPTELDSPATVTLHAATFADIVTFAAEAITFDSGLGLNTGTARPGRCDGTRVATREVSRPSTLDSPGKSRARRTQHAAALALATASDRTIQSGRCMTRQEHKFASTARRGGELLRRFIMVVKIVPNDKANPPGKLADAELHFTEACSTA